MRNYSSRISIYGALIRRWSKMLAGNSYWHLEQDIGKHFVPGALSGYYNDLTGKTQWRGLVDAEGLPLIQMTDSEPFHDPITIFQKALGHWDTWLGSKKQDTKHYKAFLQLTDWALDTQDERGGWWEESVVSLRSRCGSPYSAMGQGEGISVLVRAFSVTEHESYLESARQALAPLLTPVEVKGTLRQVPEGLVLEEYPLQLNAVLNGWIFALYGLYDFSFVEESRKVQEALEATVNALVAYLPKYSAGFWSFYDISGNLASPSYHRLHIAQLKALELTFPDHAAAFKQIRATFEQQLASRLNLTRAVALKAYQKLRHPPEVVPQ